MGNEILTDSKMVYPMGFLLNVESFINLYWGQ